MTASPGSFAGLRLVSPYPWEGGTSWSKKLTLITSLALIVAVVASPAFALGMKHHVTGNVTAIDSDSKAFTVAEDKTQKTFTFAAKDRAMLTGIKKGDHVRVAYSKNGTQLTASSVAPKAASHTASTK